MQIVDTLLSKVQMSILYQRDSGWTLSDGDILNGRPSTNGTWLYLNDEFEICDQVILKYHQTLLQAHLQ